MEEKKFDVQSLIGFLLIGAILLWMLYNNSFEDNTEENPKIATEQIDAPTNKDFEQNDISNNTPQDSAAIAATRKKLGAFGYSSSLASATNNTTTISNDVLELKIDNKGGYISEARLVKFKTYDSIPVYTIKDGNASFNINFTTRDGKVINTQDMYFEPTVTQSGENKVISMKLKVSPDEFLEYRYVLKPGEYMMDFTIRSQGLNGVINGSSQIVMDWKLKGYRHSKSISYENRYTELSYEHNDGDDSDVGKGKLNEEDAEDVTYIAYKQHFFSSILLTDPPFERADYVSKDLV